MRIGVAALSSVLFACAACGGSGGDEGETRAAKRVNDPAAKARAEAVVLKLSDFPPGWRASARNPDDESGGDEFRKCVGVDFSRFTVAGEAKSPDFAMGESTEVSSEAQVLETEAQATEGVQEFADGMASDAVEGCLKQLIEDEVKGAQEFDVGEVEVGELSLTPPEVDDVRAWQIVVPLEVTSGQAKGVSVTVYLDIVHLREVDLAATVEMSNVFTPFEPALREELVEKVADRMEAEGN